jgi:tetratricopeptide (TPR) repeat protein
MPKPHVKKGRGKSGQNLPPIPDMRANERALSGIHAALEGQQFESIEEANVFLSAQLASGGFSPAKKKGATPLEKAQDIMYDAWDSKGKQRIDLAYKALSVSKDCADAYVLLAEEAATNSAEVIRFLEDGVRAGERALGERMFADEAGHFWGILETRPYMRARFGLAQLLRIGGERARAIAIMQDLLRLNPGDNQGVRHELAVCLLEEGDSEALGKLLDEYPDEYSAVWFYSRALLKYRQEGRTPAGDACLVEALEQNRFVPLYLLGKKSFPARAPEYMSIGDQTEAVVYALDSARVWQETRGALLWMNLIYVTYRRKPAAKKFR